MEKAVDSAELDRFLRLHDGMAAMNRDWLLRASAGRLDWSPSDDPVHRFGDGRTPVTIRNLSRRLAEGDLVTAVDAEHRKTMAVAHNMTTADLGKTVIAARRRWTGMEFLRGIHAHRAFHLGHFDLCLRFGDTATPEFFVFYPDAIG